MDLNAIIQQYSPDGILPDGKVVEFKTNIPQDHSIIGKSIVAIVNYGGGYLIYGVRETNSGLDVVGVVYNQLGFMALLSRTVRELTTGIHYQFREQMIVGKLVVMISVDAPTSTIFFSRAESSPEKLTEYTFE